MATRRAGDQKSDGGQAGTVVIQAELPSGADARPAAVLCLLFEEEGEANVVLTRRSAHLRSHAGEVSFPGGRLQPGESSLRAALREAHEEIGIEAGAVALIGELTPLTTVRSPVLVHCFVGRLDGSPRTRAWRFVPDAREVEKVFWASLSRLAADGVYHEELWPAPAASAARSADQPEEGRAPEEGGVPVSYRAIPFFRLDEDVVWGATGRLLTELLCIVLGDRNKREGT